MTKQVADPRMVAKLKPAKITDPANEEAVSEPPIAEYEYSAEEGAKASLDRLAGLLKETNRAQSSIDKILDSRGKLYGDFVEQAAISQELKFVMCDYLSHNRLESYQREALEMIQHKIARILNGDPKYIDSWQDIAGYAMLVVNELKAKKEV